MANILPSALFPGYEYVAAAGTVTANSIVIPLTALGGLTTAEANATTGDGREVARTISEAIASNYLALASAARPTKMLVTKPNPQGIGVDSVRQSYTFAYDVSTDPDNQQMTSES